ncbi:MAG: ABC-F type ribosomal protection protein [Clostridia bacterium]|nr:ABC-F type ribosomal protection protein [Clostridia bacterium]
MKSTLLLEAKNLSVSYGDQTVLNDISLSLYDGDRIGLVGENGAGKSTLINTLTNDIMPDTGFISRKSDIAYIAQKGDTRAEDEEIDARLLGVFTVQEKRDGLSGGEYTRRRIAGALSHGAHILFADEPTVDLDEDGVGKLTKLLKEYDGAVVLVSHDRTLLDSVCTKIIELEDGAIREFPGNYSAYRSEKARRLQFERDEYAAYRAEEKRLKKLIQDEYEHAQKKQHLPGRMGNSEARLHKRETTNVQKQIHKVRRGFESRLERLDEKKRPREEVSIKMTLGSADAITSRTAIRVKNLSVRFDDKKLFAGAEMTVPVNSRTALLGANGAGKTTLLKHIVSGGGSVSISPGVRIGYFGQNHKEVLDDDKTALENVRMGSGHDESTCRTVLARMNIRGDDVFKKTRVMSGGECAKTALAKLILSPANLLILDEPTNHMDIFTLEALEEMLSSYAGTLVFVSHDRRFVENTATRLCFIENMRIKTFEGNLHAYYELQKRENAGQEQKNLELMITSLEMQLANLAMRLSAPKKGDNPEKLNEEYFEIAARLNKAKQIKH